MGIPILPGAVSLRSRVPAGFAGTLVRKDSRESSRSFSCSRCFAKKIWEFPNEKCFGGIP